MKTAFGVDVVDLGHPQVRGRVLSPRFLERVYSPSERRLLAAAGDGGTAPPHAWILWAAKEAAFKAVTIGTGSAPVFAHREFEVSPDEAGGGIVRWRDLELAIRTEVDAARVLAWAADDVEALSGATVRTVPAASLRDADTDAAHDLLARLSPVERASVHSDASAGVRLGVRREAAQMLGLDEDRLEVRCDPGPRGQMPPFLTCDGVRMEGVAISVSHHGDHLAWGVLAPHDQRSRGR